MCINRGPLLQSQGLLLAEREEEEERISASMLLKGLPRLVSRALLESLFKCL